MINLQNKTLITKVAVFKFSSSLFESVAANQDNLIELLGIKFLGTFKFFISKTRMNNRSWNIYCSFSF